MKLLSIAVPSYNAAQYLSHAVETLLSGGDDVEILIVDDGSTDATGALADAFAQEHPGIVRAIHKENGGHGDAVMTGLRAATGLYFKVVDSDDWVDEQALRQVLDTLRTLHEQARDVDLFVSNYVYDKVGVRHKRVIRYDHALAEGRVLTWDDVGHFFVGQYILMHAAIYRTQFLRDTGLELPKHTFYVDNLYVYVPMRDVKTLYYLNVDLYHYFIGRTDQSVQEQTMIRRIDQQLRVNRLMFDLVDVSALTHKRQREYMVSYLEIITTVSSVLLVCSGTPENLAKKDALWNDMKALHPDVYRKLRRGLIGRALHLPGRFGRFVVLTGYHISQRLFGFN